jgi:hypothetical protein
LSCRLLLSHLDLELKPFAQLENTALDLELQRSLEIVMLDTIALQLVLPREIHLDICVQQVIIAELVQLPLHLAQSESMVLFLELASQLSVPFVLSTNNA